MSASKSKKKKINKTLELRDKLSQTYHINNKIKRPYGTKADELKKKKKRRDRCKRVEVNLEIWGETLQFSELYSFFGIDLFASRNR